MVSPDLDNATSAFHRSLVREMQLSMAKAADQAHEERIRLLSLLEKTQAERSQMMSPRNCEYEHLLEEAANSRKETRMRWEADRVERIAYWNQLLLQLEHQDTRNRQDRLRELEENRQERSREQERKREERRLEEQRLWKERYREQEQHREERQAQWRQFLELLHSQKPQKIDRPAASLEECLNRLEKLTKDLQKDSDLQHRLWKQEHVRITKLSGYAKWLHEESQQESELLDEEDSMCLTFLGLSND